MFIISTFFLCIFYKMWVTILTQSCMWVKSCEYGFFTNSE